jgi:hypothetical protein
MKLSYAAILSHPGSLYAIITSSMGKTEGCPEAVFLVVCDPSMNEL